MLNCTNFFSRTLLLLLLLSVCSCSEGSGQEDSAGSVAGLNDEPELVLVKAPNPERPYFYDLGRFPYGETRQLSAFVENRSDHSVDFERWTAGCGCTSLAARWRDAQGKLQERRLVPSAEPIALPAGETLEMIFNVDSAKVQLVNKPKLVNVRVTTNSVTVPYITFEVTMWVMRNFEAVPGSLRVGTVARGGEVHAKTEIVCFLEDAFEVTGVLESPDWAEPKLTLREGLLRPQWDLEVRVNAPLETGLLRGAVTLSTSGPHGEGEGLVLSIPIQGVVVEDLTCVPPRLQFAPIQPAESASVEVELRSMLSGLKVEITSAEVKGEGSRWLSVTTYPFNPDEQGKSATWKLTLTSEAGAAFTRSFSGDVVLQFADSTREPMLISYGGQLLDT